MEGWNHLFVVAGLQHQHNPQDCAAAGNGRGFFYTHQPPALESWRVRVYVCVWGGLHRAPHAYKHI